MRYPALHLVGKILLAMAVLFLAFGLQSCKKKNKEISFPETEEEIKESIQRIQAADSDVESVIEASFSAASGGEVDVTKLAQSLTGVEGVASAYVESEDIIVLKMEDGVHINVFLDSYREDDESGSSGTKSEIVVNGKTAYIPGEEDKPHNALILLPGYDYFTSYFWGRSDTESSALIASWPEMLGNFDYGTSPVQRRTIASDYTVDNLKKNHIVIIAGKGEHNATAVGGFKKSDVIVTDIEVSKKNQTPGFFGYHPDKLSILGKVKGGTYYCITPSSVSYALAGSGALNDAWVVLLAGYSAATDDFSNAFFSCGAAAFTGCTGKIKDKKEALKIVSNMIYCLGTGMEINQAVELADFFPYSDKGRPFSTYSRFSTKVNPSLKNSPFYLFDSTPKNLYLASSSQESVTLAWEMHPSLGDYAFEVYVKDQLVSSGKNIEYTNGQYSFRYAIPGTGDYAWYVKSILLDANGQAFVSFTSDVKTFTIDTPVEPKGHLDVEPYVLDFGEVPVGTYKEITVKVSNTGRKEATIRDVGVWPPFSVNFFEPQTVSPNLSLYYTVTFAPQSLGEVTNRIVFYSDAENPEFYMSVSGTGVKNTQKRITVSPSSIDFGTYYLGDSPVNRPIHIENTGKYAVALHGIQCPTGYKSDFGEMVVLEPGDPPLSYTLFFNPTSAGEYNGSVSVLSDTDDSPQLVTVTGTAVEKPDETVYVESVTLDKTELTMMVGETRQLHATVHPDNATNKNVRWKTRNTNISVSDDGTVTALAVGSAAVVVVTEDGEFKATCEVTVKATSGGHEGTGGEVW